MSIMPPKPDLVTIFCNGDWWETKSHLEKILHQKFATVLSDEDLSNADAHVRKGFQVRPRMPASVKSSGSSEVRIDQEWFRISLDLDEFELKELDVKPLERFVEVYGKHDEKMDEHGLVSREFRRRYMVPSHCDIESLAYSVSDGKLTIKAPVSQEEQKLLNPEMEQLVDENEFKPIKNVEWVDITMGFMANGVASDEKNQNENFFEAIRNMVRKSCIEMRVNAESPASQAEPATDASPQAAVIQ